MERHYRTIFGFWALAFILITAQLKSQTAGGANGMVFRFTKQVWLNPTIILAKQSFEQSTNVKLLILPRVNGNDTTGSSRIEKAFDKLLSFLVFKENVQGSIKFYFNPKNPTKPFTFNTSDELFCKFTPIQKDSVETILNQDIVNNANLNNFTALPFDSIINRASRYCKKILQSKPGLCGENPGNEFTLTKINSTPAKLNFEKGLSPNAAAPNGGVDRKKYAELEQYYNTVLDVADNSNYPLAWKAMAANTSDVIKLKLKKKENYFDLSKLVFKNANGTETYNVTYNNIGRDSIIDLSISGKSPGSMTEVVAYYTPTTTPTQTFAIGAFNVQFYQPKTLNVVLVNLGGITLPDANAIKDSLNKIYGQAFVNWNVTTVNYTLPGTINKSIHVENSSLLSNYMPDMQPIVSSFKNNCTAYNGSSDNTYYLLFGAINDADLLGYMPRARNTGFIFLQNNSNSTTEINQAMPRTIAHELGHGAFNLKHIFSSDELGEGNRGQTNNIMDYKGNSSPANQLILYKHQWDLIHNPGFVGWFEGDDEEASLAGLTYTCSSNMTIDFNKIETLSQTSNGDDIETYATAFKDICPDKLMNLNGSQRLKIIKVLLRAPTHFVFFMGNIAGLERYNYHAHVQLCLYRLFYTMIDDQAKQDFWTQAKNDSYFLNNLHKLFDQVDILYYDKIANSLFAAINLNNQTSLSKSYTTYLNNDLFAHYTGSNIYTAARKFIIVWDEPSKKYKLTTWEGNSQNTLHEKLLSNDEYVLLYSQQELPYLTTNGDAKDFTNAVPASYLYCLDNFRKQDGDEQFFDLGVNLFAVYLGGAGLVSEANLFWKFISFCDVVSNVSIISMKSTNLRNKLYTNYGQDGADLYDNVFTGFENIQTVSAAIDFTRLLTKLGAIKGLYNKIKNSFQNNSNFTQQEKQFFRDVAESTEDIGRTVKFSLLSKLTQHPNLAAMVSRLDDVADAPLISRLDNLANTSPAKLSDLEDIYSPKKFSITRGINRIPVNADPPFVASINGKTVHYNAEGFPDFKPHGGGPDFEYSSNTLSGTGTATSGDFKAANDWAATNPSLAGRFQRIPASQRCMIKIGSNWVECTWHHYQDGRKMFPIPSAIHQAFSHTGGHTIIKKGLQDLFQ
jgi:hypothetical protein